MPRPSRRIFSPMEKRVRENLQSRAWQKRNPEKVKAAARRRWLEGDREHFRMVNARCGDHLTTEQRSVVGPEVGRIISAIEQDNRDRS